MGFDDFNEFEELDEIDEEQDFGSGFNSVSTDSDEFNNLESFDSQENTEEEDNLKNMRKVAIVIILMAIVVLTITFIIQIRTNRKKDDINADVLITDEVNKEKVQKEENSIIGENNNNEEYKKENDWKEIGENENIDINEEYSSLTFTVTDNANEARKVSNGIIEVRTVVSGSISGLSGIFRIYVPYSKGALLSVGDSFNVEVQLGDYNGNTVVNDIKY